MIPDDLTAELEGALPCWQPNIPGCRCVNHVARAAVMPILERLAAKLAAAEEEIRDLTHNVEAWKKVADENIAKRRLAEAERNGRG